MLSDDGLDHMDALLLCHSCDDGLLYDHDERTREILWEFRCCGFERAMRLQQDA